MGVACFMLWKSYSGWGSGGHPHTRDLAFGYFIPVAQPWLLRDARTASYACRRLGVRRAKGHRGVTVSHGYHGRSVVFREVLDKREAVCEGVS